MDSVTGSGRPLVSIITPMYNAADYILSCIDSVRAQSFDDWEMLIVDDVSVDNSVELVADVARGEPRIKLIKLAENSGPAVARNRAIDEAQGRFIAFLDSDDSWRPEKLTCQIEFMLTHDYAFTYAQYSRINEQGVRLGPAKKMPDSLGYNELLKTCYIGCLTAVYDSDKLGKVSMPLLRRRQDYGLWLKLLRMTDRAYLVPGGELADYRIGKDSVSSNKLKLVRYNWALFRHVEKLSLPRSIYYLLCNIVYKILKK